MHILTRYINIFQWNGSMQWIHPNRSVRSLQHILPLDLYQTAHTVFSATNNILTLMSRLRSSADTRHLLLSHVIWFYHAGIIDLQKDQGTSKTPANHRGADQVLLVPQFRLPWTSFALNLWKFRWDSQVRCSSAWGYSLYPDISKLAIVSSKRQVTKSVYSLVLKMLPGI